MELNAQQIIHYIRQLNYNGFTLTHHITSECLEPFHHLFELVNELQPIGYYNRRFLWIKANRGSFEEFSSNFKNRYTTYHSTGKWDEPDIEEVDTEAMERDWPAIFPDEEEWFGLMLSDADGIRSVTLNNILIMVVTPEIVPPSNCSRNKWFHDHHPSCHGEIDVRPLLSWMESEINRCIRELRTGNYMSCINKTLPYRYREGEILFKRYWDFYPKERERTLGKIAPEDQERFLNWYEENKDKNPGKDAFTSGDYFDACRVYYEITGRLETEDDKKTSRELYIKYSDGRDARLRDLDEDSAEAFEEWYEKREFGNHVWELDYCHKWLRLHKRDGKYVLSLEYYHDLWTDKLLPVVLALFERGLPIDAASYRGLVRKIKGEGYLAVESPLFESLFWNQKVTPLNSDGREYLRFDDKRCLRIPIPNGILDEIKWYPLPEVRIRDCGEE